MSWLQGRRIGGGGGGALETCPYQYPATTKLPLAIFWSNNKIYVYVFVILDTSEISY